MGALIMQASVSRGLEKSLYCWASCLGKMTKFCQAAGEECPSVYVPSSTREKQGRYEHCLFVAPKFLCRPRQQSEKAKGHHFLEKMSACPLPLRRVNGLLVVRLRMNWTVGGKGTLSPALAERIMDALENNTFASWTQSQPVPLCGL